MKTKRRLFCISLIVLLLSTLFINNGIAGSGVQFTVTSEPGGRNEIVVSVSISGNPGIALMNLMLYHDKDILTPKSVKNGEVTSGATFMSNANQSGVNISTLDFITALWYRVSNTYTNGKVFQVTYAVKSGTEDIPLPRLVCGTSDILNQDRQSVQVDTENGMIDIADLVTTADSGSLVRQNDTVNGSVSYTFDSRSSTEVRCTVTAAIYNSNGRLVHVVSQRNRVFEKGITNGSLPYISFDHMAGETYTIKIFFWNSLDRMVPAAPSATIVF